MAKPFQQYLIFYLPFLKEICHIVKKKKTNLQNFPTVFHVSVNAKTLLFMLLFKHLEDATNILILNCWRWL